MLDPLLRAALDDGAYPVFVLLDHTTSPSPWTSGFHVKGFTVAVGDRVVRLPATAAPFLANYWSRLTVIGATGMALQWFDWHAAVRPARYLNLTEVVRYVSAIYPVGDLPYGPGLSTADDTTVKRTYQFVRDLLAAVSRPDALYMDEYLAARNLLDLQTARGYHLPEALASFRTADGAVHAEWALSPTPKRITTASPPLHAMPVSQRDLLEARPGSRIVLVLWPEHVTKIAALVTKQDVPLHPGSDAALGHHGAPEVEDLPVDTLATIEALRIAWLETQRPYPLPVPDVPHGTTHSIGKLAQMASAAFTVQQLAGLHRGLMRRHPALLGLSDVIPYQGAISFQIDDRIPLTALHLYLMDFHAFHVKPVAWVGQTRAALYPLLDKLTPVALDFDKPATWPVECPICGGRADCERDLQQHFVEDHPQVLP